MQNKLGIELEVKLFHVLTSCWHLLYTKIVVQIKTPLKMKLEESLEQVSTSSYSGCFFLQMSPKLQLLAGTNTC